MANVIGLDHFQEAIVLGIDALIFGICLKGYYSYKNTIQALRVSIRKANNSQIVLIYICLN